MLRTLSAIILAPGLVFDMLEAWAARRDRDLERMASAFPDGWCCHDCGARTAAGVVKCSLCSGMEVMGP